MQSFFNSMSFFPVTLITLPIITAVIIKFFKNTSAIRLISFVSSSISFLISCVLLNVITSESSFLPIFTALKSNLFYIDSLSAFMAFLINFIALIITIYSGEFLINETNAGLLSPRKTPNYYFSIYLFIASMMLVIFFNNLGLIWASVELTTLTSAFLVGFYKSRESTEAAWKYLIICTVAIALSLFGVILLNYSTLAANNTLCSVDYSFLSLNAAYLNKNLLKLAFVFVLVGYGTKAGLAPMHTWLPDAHSQAPSPVAGLESAVLLSCSTYALIRFQTIINLAIGSEFTSNLLIFFGIFSLIVSFPFIVLQNDLKRLLAYSSIEHTGIIYLGLGFGGFTGILGAFYHIFNHAILKSMMFLTAGSVIQHYSTKDIFKIKGIFEKNKFLGAVFFLGGLGICGMPPFGIFFSEFMILIAGLKVKSYITVGLYLMCLTFIFIGFLHHLSRTVFSHCPEHDNLKYETPPVSSISDNLHNGQSTVIFGVTSKTAIIILFLISIISGFYMPESLAAAISKAASIITK
ncbi:MAG: proton-conducting transporter membrane subunit [Candidatus Wallbacteria bacterium]